MTRSLWIQFLRGACVMSVVLFHLSPTRFNYGYLGVDSFFVISGFLMQSLYGGIRNLDQIIYFWKKRAARLLPAYFCVIGLTYIYSLFILLPHENFVVNQHIRWSEFLLPNIGYWTDSQYWGSQEFRPLLNLWSLGVEIQFYLVFPLIAKYFFRRIPFLGLTALSFLSYLAVYQISEKSSFFLTPFRIWEFCFGILVAKLLKRNPKWIDQRSNLLFGFGCLGLASAIAIGNLDRRGMTFLIVFFTSICLTVKLRNRTLIKILSPVIWLGDRSYSIYLIHYPLLAFLSYKPFTSNSSTSISGDLWLLIVYFTLLCILSTLSFKYIESGPHRFKSYKLVASLLVFFLIFASFVDLSNLNRYRFSGQEIKSSLAVLDYAPYRCGKLFRLSHPFTDVCPLTDKDSAKENILLIGDSHADMFKAPLKSLAEDSNSSLWLWAHNESVHDYNFEQIKRVLKSQFFSKVIVTSNAGGTDLVRFERLIKASSQKFVYINPIPIYGESIPKLAFEYSGEIPPSFLQSRVQYLENHQEENVQLEQLKLQTGLQVLDLTQNLCPTMCLVVRDGQPIYSDNNHLTQTTVRRLRHRLAEII